MDPKVSFPENWSPPPELGRALPRETSMTGRGTFEVILAVVLLVAAIPVFLLVRNQDAQQAARTKALRVGGREASGQIVRLWHKLGHKGRSSTAMVTYEFTADGGRFTGNCSVPKELWDGFQEAGLLPVRYLPANPNINHPLAWEESPTPVWITVLFPVVLAAGGIALLMSLRGQAEVAAEGMPAVGVVTRCYRVKRGWVVRYQFRTQDGPIFQGSSQVGRRVEAGASVCVLYLARNPRRNQTYPLCSYKVT